MGRRGAAQAPMAARLPNLAVPAPAASFGELLRAHRERALLSQEKLAVRAGLSARTIRELEAGRVRRPRETSVRLLAQALKLQGSLRQAFEAAARPPSAQTGDAVPRAADEGCGSPPLGGGGVLWLPPPSEGVGFGNSRLLVLSLGHWLTAASSAVPAPNAMSYQAVGLRLDGQPAGLRGSRVVVVVAAAEVAVGRRGRCWACGRQETG
jgi:transcriptional regulator with XRE-family HTH domain